MPIKATEKAYKRYVHDLIAQGDWTDAQREEVLHAVWLASREETGGLTEEIDALIEGKRAANRP